MTEEIQTGKVFVLGDREFYFPERGRKHIRPWKEEWVKPLLTILDNTDSIKGLAKVAEQWDEEFDADQVGQIIAGIRPIVEQVIDVDELIIDSAIDWLLPDEDDLAYLDAHVPTRYFIAPLKWILGQIYPLAEAMRLGNGIPSDTTTPLSLPSQNGDGKKNKRPKRKR